VKGSSMTLLTLVMQSSKRMSHSRFVITRASG
jgi:hypothetical protein